MTCITIQPNTAAAVEGAPAELGAPALVGASYVAAVTDGSDATYVQQQAAATDFSYIRWGLPATSIPYASLVSIELVARQSYDSTQINGRTSVDPETITLSASARLTYSGDSLDRLTASWSDGGGVAETIEDRSFYYNLTTFPSDLETWLDKLADGDAWLETRQGGDSIGRCTRHNIYELALRICYDDVPPLRQNQRDGLRQNQQTSRQLTVRQAGYL